MSLILFCSIELPPDTVLQGILRIYKAETLCFSTALLHNQHSKDNEALLICDGIPVMVHAHLPWYISNIGCEEEHCCMSFIHLASNVPNSPGSFQELCAIFVNTDRLSASHYKSDLSMCIKITRPLFTPPLDGIPSGINAQEVIRYGVSQFLDGI
jgi:hypothetical protein